MSSMKTAVLKAILECDFRMIPTITELRFQQLQRSYGNQAKGDELSSTFSLIFEVSQF